MTRPLRRLTAVATLVLAAGYASPAAAEIQVSAFGGAFVPSPVMGLARLADDPESKLTAGPIFGARFTGLAIERIGAEFEFGEVILGSVGAGAGLSVMSLRAHALLHIITGKVRPFVTLGLVGNIALASNPAFFVTQGRLGLTSGAGLAVDLGDWWGVRGDVRAVWSSPISQGFWLPSFEGTVALYGRFPAPPPPEEPKVGQIADSDGDGLGDLTDKCPMVAGPLTNNGCPVEDDRDKDNIADGVDACPDVPGVAAFKGCPDTDEDGVADNLDLCPKDKGPASLKGCPDSDADGISDKEDKCPTEKGLATAFGCPDDDGDGIVNAQDKCPNEPETKNAYNDDDGCPDEVPKVVRDFTGVIEAIEFDPGSTRIADKSMPIMEGAVKVFKEYPQLAVQILGHTDSTGAREKNIAISKARAESVKSFFISRGLDGNRFTTIGKGPDEPRADNGTPEGRRRNRRVEFKLTNAKKDAPEPQ